MSAKSIFSTEEREHMKKLENQSDSPNMQTAEKHDTLYFDECKEILPYSEVYINFGTHEELEIKIATVNMPSTKDMCEPGFMEDFAEDLGILLKYKLKCIILNNVPNPESCHFGNFEETLYQVNLTKDIDIDFDALEDSYQKIDSLDINECSSTLLLIKSDKLNFIQTTPFCLTEDKTPRLTYSYQIGLSKTDSYFNLTIFLHPTSHLTHEIQTDSIPEPRKNLKSMPNTLFKRLNPKSDSPPSPEPISQTQKTFFYKEDNINAPEEENEEYGLSIFSDDESIMCPIL